MNYQETIDYLFTRLPMFSRMGSAAFKKDLTNTLALCEHLGNPHTHLKTIHIGGTNGKGSVSHMLAAIFQKAGYKTGLYTSPHLYDFRERIKINGEMIEEAYVVNFVAQIKPVIEQISPSFFEITVAMAMDYFDHQKVDIAIIEVGLGGRLDSTNIITPELTIITNISKDHTNMLGNSLVEIAGEKAGIIKKGIPVIIGERGHETDTVFTKTAVDQQAPIYYAEDYFLVKEWNFQNDHLLVHISSTDNNIEYQYVLDLPGLYQTKNIKTVLKAVEVLRAKGWQINEVSVKEAISQVKSLTGLFGRWEIIQHHPTVVLDVAHNEDGIKQLLQQLKHSSYQNLHIIYGMVKDKDADGVLALLPSNAQYYFTQANIPRALPAAELMAKAKLFHLEGAVFEHVNKALDQAKARASKDDLIVVCGSIFLVAEVDKQMH